MNWAIALGLLSPAFAADDDSDDASQPPPWQVRADRLQWSADGRFKGDGVWATRCACTVPPWAVRARTAEGVVGDELRLKGGALELCGRAVLPLPPMTLSLSERRTGLQLPEFGHTGQGWRVAQPLALALGKPLDVTLAPEWRSDGDLRLLSDAYLRLPNEQSVELEGAVGHDGEVRGMLGGRGAVSTGAAFASLDSLWLSDHRYLGDYGAGFLDRSAPWAESLAAAGVGPVRVESNVFGRTRPEDDGLPSRPIAGVVQVSGQPVGPLSLSAGTRVDMFDAGDDGQDRAQRLLSVIGLSGGRQMGPGAIEGRVEGRSTRWVDPAIWHEARASLATRLGLWGDIGKMRAVSDVGVLASAAKTAGLPSPLMLEERLAPEWSVGPTVRSHWLGASSVPVSFEAGLPWTPEGLLPSGAAQVALAQWGGRVSGNTDLQEAGLWWDDTRARLAVGAVRAGGLLQGDGEVSWMLPPPVHAWRPGWRGLSDLTTGRFLSQGPTLTYDSPCDCLRVESVAAWSQDRELPEFWVHLSLR